MAQADKETFILSELTTNTVMRAHDRHYCQVDGFAMGPQPAFWKIYERYS